MLARECVSENAGVAGYAEAFRCVLSGQADKHLVQVFKNRYTSLRFATVGVLPISTGDRTPRMARPVPDALSASIRHSKYAKGHILQSVPVKQPKGLSMCSPPVRPGALTRMARQNVPVKQPKGCFTSIHDCLLLFRDDRTLHS